MKTVILAGGRGTRLGQTAELIPKPMVLIGNRPILWHIMKIYSNQGFNEFVICLGEKAHVIKDYFAQYNYLCRDFTVDFNTSDIGYHNDHDERSWKVTLVDTGADTLKGGRIKRIEHYLDSQTNMLTYGDGLSNVDLVKLLAFHESHGKIITITGVRQPSRFGELDREGDKVLSFNEKPRQSDRLINGGFMVFNHGLMDYLIEDKSCDFEIGPLDKLAAAGQVMMYRHDGSWECMDHERDVAYLNELWNSGQAFWRMAE